jgi:uncharacterized protein YxeA
MKKQYIIIISIVVVVVMIVGSIFLFKGNKTSKSDNLNLQEQNQNQDSEKVTIASLVIGNWVSVVAEKSNGSYAASMVMVCDSKDSCANQNRTKNGTVSTGETKARGVAPSGTAPTGSSTPPSGDIKTGSSMENKTMLSGTIVEINTDNIVLNLDTGETATILISDSTRIDKR